MTVPPTSVTACAMCHTPVIVTTTTYGDWPSWSVYCPNSPNCPAGIINPREAEVMLTQVDRDPTQGRIA